MKKEKGTAKRRPVDFLIRLWILLMFSVLSFSLAFEPLTQAKYIHGMGIDEPISMTRGADTYYYTADGLGSINELTDTSEVGK